MLLMDYRQHLLLCQAAAHPAKTNYLFFVANGTGGHTFSDNYGNHLQAVNEYRKLSK